MIALSQPFSGNLHGLRGADLQCYREARAAGYTTTFRAMLSSNVQDLVRIVHSVDFDTTVVNVAGHHLFPSWRSFVNGAQMNPHAKLFSFDRHDVLNDSRWSVGITFSTNRVLLTQVKTERKRVGPIFIFLLSLLVTSKCCQFTVDNCRNWSEV